MAALGQVTGLQPPSHYISIKISQAERLIDCLGGINLDIPADIRHRDQAAGEAWTFMKGPAHLNGKQAVQLFRTRHGLGDGSERRLRVDLERGGTGDSVCLRRGSRARRDRTALHRRSRSYLVSGAIIDPFHAVDSRDQ